MLACVAIVISIIVAIFTEINISNSCSGSRQNTTNSSRGVADKPLIYLYPEQETTVSVQLGFPEKLTTTYPTYTTAWQVIAHPDGKLTDTKTNRELYGLYWEGKDSTLQATNEGFVVAGSDTSTFLEEKLALLGLNEREANEFIIYWLPKLQSNNYNYIRFATPAEIEENMPLSITPTPDTTIRIMMVSKPLESPIEVTPQELSHPERYGFTAVEWGGTIVGSEVDE